MEYVNLSIDKKRINMNSNNPRKMILIYQIVQYILLNVFKQACYAYCALSKTYLMFLPAIIDNEDQLKGTFNTI